MHPLTHNRAGGEWMRTIRQALALGMYPQGKIQVLCLRGGGVISHNMLF